MIHKAEERDTTAAPTAVFDSAALLRSLTSKPGVYRMLDDKGKVLYVGKARNLKKRVSSYFIGGADGSPKTRALMARVRDIEVTVTRTEKEALILENNQIKLFKPRYNIWFKDDKSYPYIYLSTQHEFPAFAYHRGARNRKGRYFGPYPSALAARKTLHLMKKLFKNRQCRDSFFANRTRPCLEHQIKRCSAPCTGVIDRASYRRDVERSIMFLEGENEQIMEELQTLMQKATDTLDYERAIEYRDQIQNIRKLQESQYITHEKGNIDVVACRQKAGASCVLVCFIRNGLNQGSRAYFPAAQTKKERGENHAPADVMEAFLRQFYLDKYEITGNAPREILLSHAIGNVMLLEEAIAVRIKRRVKIKHRLRGDRAKWLGMALENAELALSQRLANNASRRKRTDHLRQFLGLDVPLLRLECFDVSHTMGEATIASCVVFDADGPLTGEYRKFNISNIIPGDDCAAMEQALTRRYTRLKKEGVKIPDVILVDGGKGQFGAARKILDELQITDPVLIGVAKGRSRKPGLETLMVDSEDRQISLPPHSEALHLIQHIRDEAHRFAISGHRRQRQRKRGQSPLEQISGIGQKRRQELLRYFGGLQGIRSAGVEDLVRVSGINKNLAQKIYRLFHELA